MRRLRGFHTYFQIDSSVDGTLKLVRAWKQNVARWSISKVVRGRHNQLCAEGPAVKRRRLRRYICLRWPIIWSMSSTILSKSILDRICSCLAQPAVWTTVSANSRKIKPQSTAAITPLMADASASCDYRSPATTYNGLAPSCYDEDSFSYVRVPSS
jgi:hypothetical protein